MTEQALRCGWCDTLLRPGTQPETTGVCKPCAGEVEARTWQPRWRAEIDQILHDSGENDQNTANPDHLTPEETAAKADATRVSWAETQEKQGVVHEAERAELPENQVRNRGGGDGISGQVAPVRGGDERLLPRGVQGVARRTSPTRQESHKAKQFSRMASSVGTTFSPPPPAPYVPRNRVDPVRVLCFAACALLLGVVWAQIARWAL